MSKIELNPLNSKTYKLENDECVEILGGVVTLAAVVTAIQAFQALRDANTETTLQVLGVLAPNPNQPVKDVLNEKIARKILE